MGSVEDSTDRTKKPKMNTFSAALLLTAGLVSSAPGGGYYKGYGRSQPSKNVFNTLASDPQFSTLVAAVTAAGLTEKAISDLGPLTIFAPTNDAFAKIHEDTLNGLLGDVPPSPRSSSDTSCPARWSSSTPAPRAWTMLEEVSSPSTDTAWPPAPLAPA